jgi:hypothetical protein
LLSLPLKTYIPTGSLLAILIGQFAGPSILPAQAQSVGTQASHSVAPTTILPTDVVPLPQGEQRMSYAQNLQFRALDKLPSRFYLNATCETSFRDETNPFQFPTKRQFIKRFMPAPPVFRTLLAGQQASLLSRLESVNRNNMVFRFMPNITAGWALTPKTRFFGNYFLIRDQLNHSPQLNTTIQSLAYGIQRDTQVGKRASLQTEFQVRTMFQQNYQTVYDFLPSMTFSYLLTPRTLVYANTLLQLRGNGYYQCPTREISPFYSFGAMHSRGAWTFASNATLVQNFREMFGRNAPIQQDNYSWICTFEIGKRLFKQMPGVQAFVRAEPIYNFKAHDTPGLSGMDFRLYCGVRVALSKPPLNQALEQIRNQIEEMNEPAEPPPGQTADVASPQAYVMPEQVIASSVQPIHGAIFDTVKLSNLSDEPFGLISIHATKQDNLSDTPDYLTD